MGCEKVRSNFWIFRKFKNYFKTGTLVLAILAMLTWLLIIFAAKNPETVEKLYSSTVYPYIAKSIGLIFGIFPISIAEIIIIIIFVLVLTGLLFLLFSPKKILDNKKLIINKIISCTSLVYILFYFLWGFNYYRQEYSVLADMDTDLGTLEELFELSLEIINNLNEIRYNLLEDESGVFYVTENIRELSRQAQKGFEDLWIGTINLSGNYGHVKPILLSGFMSYTGITGIYFPFTFEPNVNMDIPHHNLLATICHEIAHQRGFAKEDEANFIAYRAAVNNPNDNFKYSGYYLAMRYLLTDLFNSDEVLYKLIYSKISDAVKRDMNFSENYWVSKEGSVERVVTAMNDMYLKANNQSQGIKSYNKVVNLLISEYRQKIKFSTK